MRNFRPRLRGKRETVCVACLRTCFAIEQFAPQKRSAQQGRSGDAGRESALPEGVEITVGVDGLHLFAGQQGELRLGGIAGL